VNSWFFNDAFCEIEFKKLKELQNTKNQAYKKFKRAGL